MNIRNIILGCTCAFVTYTDYCTPWILEDRKLRSKLNRSITEGSRSKGLRIGI